MPQLRSRKVDEKFFIKTGKYANYNVNHFGQSSGTGNFHTLFFKSREIIKIDFNNFNIKSFQ
ncbi:hypothetical protein C0J52_23701 [Blattella germanica]|nr:hypothetical protein C0J52_23701 [Blattella germanica]